jgi:hypothetical protein
MKRKADLDEHNIIYDSDDDTFFRYIVKTFKYDTDRITPLVLSIMPTNLESDIQRKSLVCFSLPQNSPIRLIKVRLLNMQHKMIIKD